MTGEFIQLAAVTAGLISLIVIPFVPVAFLFMGGGQWPRVVLTALVMGSSLQASLGLVWTHVVGKHPSVELAVYAACWFGLLLWGIWKYRTTDRGYPSHLIQEKISYFPLLVILAAAFAVRVIHPLQVTYLGQSDAYTHLNYLHNIVNLGYLINPVYPSGYHWILALPAMVFSMDPYLVGRFGGAFFGVGLVLALYVLLERFFDRRTALFGSFCSACFPLMTLLMKTGVGAFANQFGLMLLPAIFFFYHSIITDRNGARHDKYFLAMSLCGLAAAVPMMLLHILVIILIERLLSLFRLSGRWFSMTWKVSIVVLPALFLLGFHLSQVGAGHRFQTANIMIGHGEKKQLVVEKMKNRVQSTAEDYSSPSAKPIIKLITESPYFRLIVDYASIKRRSGFGNVYLNGLGCLLAVFFLTLALLGFIKDNRGLLLTGLWGGITTIQAGTGFLQFSSYQREGWSLLIATCCLSGVLAEQLFRYGSGSRLFKAGVGGIMAASFAWAMLHPPGHPAIRSGAEGDVVDAVRFFGQDFSVVELHCRKSRDQFCGAFQAIVPGAPLTLVSRRFTGWGNQGEITRNVLPRGSSLKVVTVGNNSSRTPFSLPHQYIVLVDAESKLSGSNVIQAFAMVTPGMVEQTLRNRRQLFRANAILLEYIEKLPEDKWRVNEILLSDSLKAFMIAPIQR